VIQAERLTVPVRAVYNRPKSVKVLARNGAPAPVLEPLVAMEEARLRAALRARAVTLEAPGLRALAAAARAVAAQGVAARLAETPGRVAAQPQVPVARPALPARRGAERQRVALERLELAALGATEAQPAVGAWEGQPALQAAAAPAPCALAATALR